MPSYYNHKSKARSGSDSAKRLADPTEFFNEDDFLEQKRDIQKVKVKYLKTTTDKTRMEIAEELGCSTSHVDTLWKEVQEDDAFELEKLADKEIRKQLREYEYMKMELFTAWHESKKEFEKTKTETGIRADKAIEVEVYERFKKMPKIDYFSEIRQINGEIAKLLGIVKLTEINFNQQNNNVSIVGEGPDYIPDDFDAFTKRPDALPEGEFTSIDDDDDSLPAIDGELDSID